MKRNILLIIVFLFSSVLTSWSQATLASKINQVYGEYASSLPEAQHAWIENCYSRCEVLTESDVPEGVLIQNLNDVGVITKYVSTLEIDTTYDSANFNPLKYALNFHKKYDQYYRIGSTIYILKVHKKAE